MIWVYPPLAQTFQIGMVQQRNLIVKGGNCNHRAYIPVLVGLVATDALDPTELISKNEPIVDAVEAYEIFDRREPDWLKVELQPSP